MIYLEEYLKQNIPLYTALGLSVESFSPKELVMKAPLAPNKNDKNTAFAGSIYSSAVLTGWGFLFLKLKEAQIENELVVYHAEIKYFQPIQGDFQTRAHLKDPQSWDVFLEEIRQKNKAKITVEIEVCESGEPKTLLTASYSAKKKL